MRFGLSVHASILTRPADTERCRVVLAFHIDDGPLIGEMMGLERAPIEYEDDETRHSVKVGDAIDIEIVDEVHEGMTEPAMLTNIPLPWNSTMTIAQATRSRVNAFGLEFDNTGKNGHAAPFSWAA